MISNLKNFVWSISLLLCYPLYSIGQMYLFISKQKEPDFYELLNTYSGDWIAAHLFLMISLVLLIPAFTGLCYYFKHTKSYPYIQLSTFFIILSVFPLFGQYTIDLCLIQIFKLPKELAYQTLDKIQHDSLISALFYDNSKLFVLFKYADLTFLGQVFLGIALFTSKRIPAWTKALFVIVFLFTQFGILIHPYYGRIIKRSGYSLISVSLIPVVVSILKKMDSQGEEESPLA